MKPRIDVLIPAFNEELSVEKVIREIPDQLVREIIVCDNGSTDQTAARARFAGATVVSQVARGYGNACTAGVEYLLQLPDTGQPDIVVFLDADYSDYPAEMDRVVAPILEDGYDMVIGSRTLGTAKRGSLQPQQVFGNWLATTLIRAIYGYSFTDLGPFRAIRWKKLLELRMQDKNFGWTVEMQVKAAKHGLRCTEVPVSYRPRIGKSKVSGTVRGSFLAGVKIIWTILRFA